MRVALLGLLIAAFITLPGCLGGGEASKDEPKPVVPTDAEAPVDKYGIPRVEFQISAQSDPAQIAVKVLSGGPIEPGAWRLSITAAPAEARYCIPAATLAAGTTLTFRHVTGDATAAQCEAGEPAGAPIERGTIYSVKIYHIPTGAPILDRAVDDGTF